MRTLIIFLILSLFAGCKAVKDSSFTSVETSMVKSDSLRLELVRLTELVESYKSEKTVITKAANSNIELEDPCDSLTGLLRDFQIKAGNSVVKSEKGKIIVETHCPESIEKLSVLNRSLISQRDSLIKVVANHSESQMSFVEKKDRAIIYKVPLRFWLFTAGYVLLSGILLWLYFKKYGWSVFW